MKKSYVRPEWNCEEFALSQHIAKGCGSNTTVAPGTEVTADFVACKQLINKDGTLSNAGGHWSGTNIKITDTNGNGTIDWSEFVAAVGTAQNGAITGGGHEGHNLQIKLPDQEITILVPLNS